MASPAFAPSRLGPWAHPVRLGLAFFAALTAIAFAWRLWVVLAVEVGSVVGVDRGINKEAALRWAGGGFWFYRSSWPGPTRSSRGTCSTHRRHCHG